jgi:hypothetical protein
MQDFDFEIQSAQERRRMAQALRNQGFQMPEAQMVGGRYIAPGIDQVLVQALKQYGATKEEKAAENQIRALNQQRAEKMQSALDEFLIKSQGRPAEVLPPDVAGPPRPAEPQDMPGAFRALMGAPDAGYRQACFTGAANFAQQQAEQQRKAQENQRLMSILQSSTPQQAIAAGVPVETVKSYYESRNFGRDKVARTVEIEGARGEKLIQSYDDFGQPIGTPVPAYLAPIQLNRGNKIELVKPAAGQSFTVGMSPSEAANVSLRGQEIQLRRQEIANKPEKQVSILDPETGNAVLVNESDAIGQQRYTPQAATQIREQIKGQKARSQMNTALMELKGYYDTLREGGGIVSQNQGSIGNIAARSSSSSLGQMIGGAVGAKNQIARDKIEQTRPLLLNLIKEATGMSAQQMNSNAEMQLYLRAATDPTLSYEANIQALDNLDKMFGLGIGISSQTDQSRKQTGQLSPQDQQAIDWANANSNDPRAAEIKRRLGVK